MAKIFVWCLFVGFLVNIIACHSTPKDSELITHQPTSSCNPAISRQLKLQCGSLTIMSIMYPIIGLLSRDQSFFSSYPLAVDITMLVALLSNLVLFAEIKEMLLCKSMNSWLSLFYVMSFLHLLFIGTVAVYPWFLEWDSEVRGIFTIGASIAHFLLIAISALLIKFFISEYLSIRATAVINDEV